MLRVVTYAVEGWGIGELALVGDRPVSHELPVPTRPATRDHVYDEQGLGGRPRDALRVLLTQVYAFFRGERTAWNAHELGLGTSVEEWGFSPFMQRAAHALVDVPWGETVSYRDLAALAGLPRAARAAGTFCGRSPLGLFVPCHRVIASNGSLGGYGSYGTPYKRRLLALEGHC